jgi:starch-binding outer membrane protein, SusD/RagB family
MKRLFIYAIMLIAVGVNFSCNKQLDALPKNAKVDATAIVDQRSAQIALNGVYYRLANVTTDNITDWTTHQVFPAMLAGSLGYAFGALPDELNDNVNAGYPPQVWSRNYLIVNAANGVINGVNSLSDDAFTANRKKEILSEARFLRAYADFKLLTFFAEWYKISSPFGVLLRDELSTLSNIPKARSNVADSYKSIIDDLDFAIANGPATNPNYYATKWAAMALKMRVLINRGQQNDYTDVMNLGNTMMQTGPFVLENNLKDLFYVKGLSSKEVILGIKPQPNQEAFYYILSRDYYPFASSGFVAKKAFKDLLQNDPRGTWMVGPANPYSAYSPNTFYFTKYIAYGGTTSQLTETSYAFRLSEVYLLTAEATVRSGGSLATAKGLIKTVMGKAGVTDFSAVDNATTADDLLLQNYYEVLRNLSGEDGIEWTTLLRLPFATVKQLKPTIIDQKQYIFPIPLDEFQQNPAIGDQNPGYSK